MTITRPEANEFPVEYSAYINRVKDDDLIEELELNFIATMNLINDLNDEQLNYRYAPGKWTIKEILVHLMDAERIFDYRALRFSRKDKTKLAGFEENDYAPASYANERSIQSIMSEFALLRQSTTQLFLNFNKEQLSQFGIANENHFSVRGLGYAIAGHELHHINVIKTKYL